MKNKLRKRDQCQYIDCKEPIYKIFRVRVLNPLVNRRYWRSVKFCKDHFSLFLKDSKSFHVKYKITTPGNIEDEIQAPVIDFKLDLEI